VPADQLEARVDEVAERLTTLAPLTLAATKESIRRIVTARTLDSEEGEDLVLSCYMSDDFRGAVRAFVEKRKYTWTGR
jgi:enoyl-CoA hydratase/carnithine racemase